MIRKSLLWGFLITFFFSIHGEGKASQFIDEVGRKVKIPDSAKRIVSLAPSITETLFALGLREEIVGVTNFCDYPPVALSKPKIGGFLIPDIERVISLNPDLVIGIKDGNQMEAVQRLTEFGFSVYLVDPKSFDGVARTIQNIGEIVGRRDESRRIVTSMVTKKEHILALTRSLPRLKVFFQVGDTPIITVGRETLADDLIRLAGGRNISENEPMSYPLYSLETVMLKAPEVIIISSMHRDRNYSNLVKKWQNWKSIPAVKMNAIYVLDSNLVDRPTSRITDGLEAIAEMTHPEVWGKKMSYRRRN